MFISPSILTMISGSLLIARIVFIMRIVPSNICCGIVIMITITRIMMMISAVLTVVTFIAFIIVVQYLIEHGLRLYSVMPDCVTLFYHT